MNELTTTAALVKSILQNDIQARNSDSLLYLQVITTQAEEKGLDLNSIPITDFLLNQNEYGLTPFETVRRTRQKVQQHYPHLAGSKAVKKARSERQEDFLEFARGLV